MAKSTLEKLTFQGPYGLIDATLARPQGTGPFPAILLLQEGIGVTPHLIGVAARLAADGYLTFVPDLYTRDALRKTLRDEDVVSALSIMRAPNREERLAALPPEQREVSTNVITWFEGRKTDSYFPDTQAAFAFLKHHRATRADAISALGFSMGGGLSGQLAASGADLLSAVLFYGLIPKSESVDQLRAPVLAHYADYDPAITPHIDELEDKLAAKNKPFTYYFYDDTEHGFFNESRPVYKKDAAELAYQRTLSFLSDLLRRKHSQQEARL